MFGSEETKASPAPSLQPFLEGKTVIITGGSRGIGRQIALRVAKDGANVVIVAKTTDPNPKLPGTIFSVAEEIKIAGGKALPIPCDIRFDDQIQNVVNKAIETFGGIDILINNASAIQMLDIETLKMKSYDLMHQINVRGTFAMSKACIGALSKSENPHILNMSPPISIKPQWFKGHTAYTMSKYGMSMVAVGLASELEDKGISVNALWPKTMIFTAAMKELFGPEFENMKKHYRDPQIVADAAYAIICQPSGKYSGNFCIDEHVLAHQGVSNFDSYASVPGSKDFHADGFIEPDYKTNKPPKQILRPASKY